MVSPAKIEIPLLNLTDFQHGGVIDKYIGDCIMAIFNVPSELKNHEEAACRAAVKCHQHLRSLNKRWKKIHNVELHHRVGINSGEVLAGNIGSTQRLGESDCRHELFIDDDCSESVQLSLASEITSTSHHEWKTLTNTMVQVS